MQILAYATSTFICSPDNLGFPKDWYHNKEVKFEAIYLFLLVFLLQSRSLNNILVVTEIIECSLKWVLSH